MAATDIRLRSPILRPSHTKSQPVREVHSPSPHAPTRLPCAYAPSLADTSMGSFTEPILSSVRLPDTRVVAAAVQPHPLHPGPEHRPLYPRPSASTTGPRTPAPRLLPPLPRGRPPRRAPLGSTRPRYPQAPGYSGPGSTKPLHLNRRRGFVVPVLLHRATRGRVRTSADSALRAGRGGDDGHLLHSLAPAQIRPKNPARNPAALGAQAPWGP